MAGRLADPVVPWSRPATREWLPKFVQVAVAAVPADHPTVPELAHRPLEPYAGRGRGGHPGRQLGLGGRASRAGGRDLGRTEDGDGHPPGCGKALSPA